MKVIRTHEMNPETLSEFEKEMCYNGLDCCVTLDVYDGLRPQLDNITAATSLLERGTVPKRLQWLLHFAAR